MTAGALILPERLRSFDPHQSARELIKKWRLK